MKFQKTKHHLHNSASGAEYFIDVYNYQHPEAQKTVYIQAGLHGIEITGIPALFELIDHIEKTQPKINFICVPQANPMALDSQIMSIQVGYNNIHTNNTDSHNWNRICHLDKQPSIEGNWISLLLDLSKNADFVIDLHCAGFATIPHLYCQNQHTDLAKGFGISEILSWQDPCNAFEDTCFSRGQKAFTLELSASRNFKHQELIQATQFLKNFLLFLESNQKIYSPAAGILDWHIQAGEKIHQGQILGKIYQNNRITKEIISEENGIVLIIETIQAPHQKQQIGVILKD
jgi:predicted deacylase